MEERLRARTGELDAARTSADAADERAAEAEARARDMYEENKRLSEHISVSGGRGAGCLPACQPACWLLVADSWAAGFDGTGMLLPPVRAQASPSPAVWLTIVLPLSPRRTWSRASAPRCTRRSRRKSSRRRRTRQRRRRFGPARRSSSTRRRG